MPNSFIYSEGYKTKYADLNKMEDAIISVAKFLHKKARFDTLINWKKMPNIPKVESAWYDYAFKYDDASFVYEKSTKTKQRYHCFSCKNKKLQYMRKYTKKIMKYNNSSNYAVGVMRLAYDAHKLLNK
jgi:membrane-bound lytic murein transglycosylase B